MTTATVPTASSPARTAGGRKVNFSAGPAALPEPVLEQVQKDLWDFQGCGVGVCEMSHRSKEFDDIYARAVESCRKIAAIPDTHRVIFFQGGATTQAAMIPRSFLPAGATADYVETGKWAKDGIKEAKKFGNVNVAYSSADTNFDRVPLNGEGNFIEDAAYTWFCANNTIYGTEFTVEPNTKTPLVCDASSDMFSRPIDWSKYAMMYGGAQKNLGPSGQALVVISEDFLTKAPEGSTLPMMWDYNLQNEKESRSNTPNTFAIYIMGLVFDWLLKEFGTLEEVAKFNQAKAKLIYDVIDGSGGFYKGHAIPECRSLMNITFNCQGAEIEDKFKAEAKGAGFNGLNGHRSVGGMRASVYNAIPMEGCEQLVAFMKQFQADNS